jgi:hypothetical protein
MYARMNTYSHFIHLAFSSKIFDRLLLPSPSPFELGLEMDKKLDKSKCAGLSLYNYLPMKGKKKG